MIICDVARANAHAQVCRGVVAAPAVGIAATRADTAGAHTLALEQRTCVPERPCEHLVEPASHGHDRCGR